MTTRKLSQLQKAILADLLALYEHYQKLNHPIIKRRFPHEGVPLKYLNVYAEKKTASDRAAFSRALRRLERRGLVVRVNVRSGILDGPEAGNIRNRPDQPHRKSDHLLLTHLGKETAETVNKKTRNMLTVCSSWKSANHENCPSATPGPPGRPTRGVGATHAA